MATGTRIHLCGGLRYEVAGTQRETALRGRQGRLLFAFLVLRRGRPVTRDALIDALWGEDAPPPSEGALAPVLSRLRRAIAPATLEGRDGLVLSLADPAWIDVEAARAAVTHARSAADAAARLTAAQESIAIVDAGLLPGLEAQWLEEERTALEHLRIDALELGAEAARGVDPPLAEQLARAAIAAAPYRESAWVALIAALTARGNVAEALRAYDEVRRLLRDELGTTPGRELIDLHSRLLAGDAPGRRRNRPPRRRRPRARRWTICVRCRAPRAGARTGRARARAPRARFRARSTRRGRRWGGAVRGTRRDRQDPAAVRAPRPRGDEGNRVLEARAGLLEREYGFGVVRQLLEPAADPSLMEGAAAAARVVLGESEATEGTFPILNGLFRFVERLAAGGPLALCVDDLQWSDPASLRFAAYLARRVGGLPVLLAATIRTGEPEADESLLGELAQEPVSVALNPRPLTAEATRELIGLRLGGPAEESFIAACHAVTAGNPLLLGQLLSALAAEGVRPDAAGAGEVRGIGPRAVARTVLLRLRRLQPPAVAVARAVAVLGELPALTEVAALAGVEEASAAAAVQALARAEILRADESLGFVHPLIRDAVYGELTAPERALEHERAARLLADRNAGPERIAAQLLLAPARGDAWTVTRLREAAQLARRRGAPDAAMRLLERAQAEPPPPGQQAALAFELGGSAAYLRGPAGVEPLHRAYADLTDPAERARAAIQLSHLLLFVRSPAEGVALARQASDELPDGLDDLRDGLRAVRLVGAAFGAVDPAEFRALEDVRRGPRGTGPGARALTAMAALAVALTCGPAAEATVLAREAFSSGLQVFEITAPVALGSAALALGDPAEGLQAIARYSEHARRQGEILGSIGADLWGGIAEIWAGDLRAAMRLLERAHEGERLWGTKLDAVMAYSAAFTARVQLERGDPTSEVGATLHRVSAEDPRPDGARFWLASLAELAIAEGRPREAVTITERLESARPADTHPVWAPWRSLRARALAALGDRTEAERLAREDLALAERIGAGWVIGRGLRILAGLGGPDQVDLAREAIARLEPGSARLELAKAEAFLAEGLARAGAGEEARAEWARTAQLAHGCGATGLARLAGEAANVTPGTMAPRAAG